MPITVKIPGPLQKLTGGKDAATVEASTVAGVIDGLDQQFPGIKARLLDDQGSIRRFVLVYVNGEDIRFGKEQQTPVKEGDEVSILPAIAGGLRRKA